MPFAARGVKVWERELDVYGSVRTIKGDKDFIPQLYQGQYVDEETGLAYNRFRYYDCESGNYISQDPIGLSGGLNVYNYVKDSNEWVDILGLSGEIVYQLLNSKGDVIYYGITNRDALTRMAEHGKTKVFDNMEILADGLSHDEARSIEGALIRQRTNERLSLMDRLNLSVEAQLEKAGLLNKNRGRIKERWTSENPLNDLKDKMHSEPKKVHH